MRLFCMFVASIHLNPLNMRTLTLIIFTLLLLSCAKKDLNVNKLTKQTWNLTLSEQEFYIDGRLLRSESASGDDVKFTYTFRDDNRYDLDVVASGILLSTTDDYYIFGKSLVLVTGISSVTYKVTKLTKKKMVWETEYHNGIELVRGIHYFE